MKWYATSWPELAAEFERIEREQMPESQVLEQPVAVVGVGCCGRCNKFAADVNHLTNQHELDLGTIRQLSMRIAELENEARGDALAKITLQQEIERMRCNAEYCGSADNPGLDTSVLYNQQ